MSHQDFHARSVRLNSADLQAALQWLFAGVDWSSIRFRIECTWTAKWLAWAAVLWAWSGETALMERFACAQRLIRHLQKEDAKVPTSYQAFLKILRHWTSLLVQTLQVSLRSRMITLSPEHWKIHGWIVFGVDGTKIRRLGPSKTQLIRHCGTRHRTTLANRTSRWNTPPIRTNRGNDDQGQSTTRETS